MRYWHTTVAGRAQADDARRCVAAAARLASLDVLAAAAADEEVGEELVRADEGVGVTFRDDELLAVDTGLAGAPVAVAVLSALAGVDRYDLIMRARGC